MPDEWVAGLPRQDPSALMGMMPIVAEALDRSDNLVAFLRPSPFGLVLHEVNDAFCRATLRPARGIAGTRLRDLAGPDTPPALLARLIDLPQGESLRDEMQCVRPDGSRFWLGLHLMPAMDPVSGAACFVLLGRDISAKREERQHSAAILHLLARVFVAIDAAVAIITPDGRILKSNPRLHRLSGQDGAALEGSRVMDLIHRDDRGTLEEGLARLAGAGTGEHRQVLRVEHGAPGTSRSSIVAELTVVPIDPMDATPMRLLTFRDVPATAEVFQVAGKIQMIGLGEVKTVLGPRWPALRERAMAAAEHVLGRKLGPQDSFSRTRDDGFLICFAELSEDEASFTAAMIARDIRARLIGQGEDPDASAVVAIAGSVVLAPPPPIAIPGLPWPQGPDPARFRDVVEQRLCAQRAAIEALARQTLSSAVAEARCELSPIVGRDGRQIIAHYARLPPALHRSLATAAALPEAERRKTDLDVLALRLAGHQAMEQVLMARSGLVFLDLSFEVFQSRITTDCYLDACRRLDLSVRQGLVLVLNGLPEGLTSSRMLDCIHRLRPFCRAVGFALDSIDLPTLDLALASGPVLVLDAAAIPDIHVASPRLDKLIAHAHALRARILVRGEVERHVCNRLLAGGVDLVTLAPLSG